MTNTAAAPAAVEVAKANSGPTSADEHIDRLLESLDMEKKNQILKYVLGSVIDSDKLSVSGSSADGSADDDSAIGKIINCALSSTSASNDKTAPPGVLELSSDECGSPDRATVTMSSSSPVSIVKNTSTAFTTKTSSLSSSSPQAGTSDINLEDSPEGKNNPNVTAETGKSTPFKASNENTLDDSCSVISNLSSPHQPGDAVAVKSSRKVVATAAMVSSTTPPTTVSRKSSRHISESDVHSMNFSTSPSVGDDARRQLFNSKSGGREDFQDCHSEISNPSVTARARSRKKSKNITEASSGRSYTWKPKKNGKKKNGDDCSTLSGSAIPSVRTSETTSTESGDEDEKLERVEIHDMSIYTLVYCALIALVVGYTWVYKAIALSLEDGYWTRCGWFAFLPLITGMMMFPFKLVFFNVLSIFGSWRNINKNSKYHSAFASPVPAELPPVCVQMPVYKESFEETILPSLISIYKAIDYYTAMGGDAHMFVNDDGLMLVDEKERQERITFYRENNIAYIARPSHDVLPRHGLFKKASNMNFCLNFAMDVGYAEKNLALSKEEAIQHVIDSRPYDCLAGGPIGIGSVEYILLVDSDTRVPEKCLYQTVGEFVLEPNLGFIQHTMSVLRVGKNYWEDMLAHWTWTLYNLFIPMGTANGEPAPLVGHNATLNWKLVNEVSTFDEKVGYRKYWSESHVSEDFDLSLRLQSRGYIGRYAMYTGMGFQEGVSLTVEDEIIKLKKFAYGAGEMMFQKFRHMLCRGMFAPLIKDYLKTSAIPLAARVNMVAYFFTFFAMAWGVLFLPLSFFLSTITPYEQVMATAWENYIGVMLSFLVVGTAGTIILKFLMGVYGSLWAACIDELRHAPLIAMFYAGVQWHMFTGFFRYMLDLKAEWGATVKELDDSNISFKTFILEVKRIMKAYWFMYLFPVFGQAGFFAWFYMYGPEHIHYNGYVLAPFFSFIGAHFLMPIVLNPIAMRCAFGWIPKLLCCLCRKKQARSYKKLKEQDSIVEDKEGGSGDVLDLMELGGTTKTIHESNTSADEEERSRSMTQLESYLIKSKLSASGEKNDDESSQGYMTPDEKEETEEALIATENRQKEAPPSIPQETKQEESPTTEEKEQPESPAELPSGDGTMEQDHVSGSVESSQVAASAPSEQTEGTTNQEEVPSTVESSQVAAAASTPSEPKEEVIQKQAATTPSEPKEEVIQKQAATTPSEPKEEVIHKQAATTPSEPKEVIQKQDQMPGNVKNSHSASQVVYSVANNEHQEPIKAEDLPLLVNTSVDTLESLTSTESENEVVVVAAGKNKKDVTFLDDTTKTKPTTAPVAEQEKVQIKTATKKSKSRQKIEEDEASVMSRLSDVVYV